MCGFLVYVGQDKEFKTQIPSQFELLKHRGPDHTGVVDSESGLLCFHRLSIMDLTYHGNQPLFSNDKEVALVCNGEIYNHEVLRKEISYDYQSHSDCEVILPLFEQFGIETCLEKIDGEFAFVLYDKSKERFIAARDPIGIRPLFYGYNAAGEMLFASEMKGLHSLCKGVKAFPPGHYFDGESIKEYCDLTKVETYLAKDETSVLEGIKHHLTKAVEKRLNADAPVGFLLSGGLDSSLVCSIAQRASEKPIRTFAIGMETDAIDLKYAKIVADYLGTDHTEVIITKDDVFEALKKTIWHLETWDITTIRASLGMFLLCKYIHEKTDIKVLLTGEVSDELFGYKYTDFAPNAEEFQKESEKRIKELYMYDVLRADRCISAHSLEARVPFSDRDFVGFVMHIDPEMKMNSYQMGKYLLRKAFEKGDYLPESILFRDKAAFSDAVGHSLVDELKLLAEQTYTEQDVRAAELKYQHGAPHSKEALLYRDIFSSFYEGREELIASFWLPNQEWENCSVLDPSARFLPNYGKSGV
ncbi:MAG: asparagine synthase B [Oligoflexales bacterium]|nr:asparagine synthase B [Oligoflexales bacterium]